MQDFQTIENSSSAEQGGPQAFRHHDLDPPGRGRHCDGAWFAGKIDGLCGPRRKARHAAEPPLMRLG